jgi:outer membrane protein
MKKSNGKANLSLEHLVLVLVAFVGVVAAPAAAESAAKRVTIAVVRDGPSEVNEILDRIRPELDHLVGADYEVTFDESDEFDARWDAQRTRLVIENALRNRAVDMIVGIGVLVTQEAAQPDLRLTKPFVSATLLTGDIPKLDFEEDRSLKDNLCVVVRQRRADTDVEMITRMQAVKRLCVAMGAETLDRVAGIHETLARYSRETGIEIVPLAVSADWRPALDKIGSDVDAVYFLKIPRLPRSGRAAFVEALNDRALPTYSGVGPQDLEIGMLATNQQDLTQALTRRVALNLFQLIAGASTDDLPVMLMSDSKLVINGKTAAKIGFPLGFEARVLGTLLYPEALEAEADSLNLGDVLLMADAGNVELSISNQEVLTALRGKQVVRSPMLPQIGAGADYNNYDNNLVGTLLPDQFGRATLRLSQMIFDDQLISDFRTAGREYDAAMYQNEANRLDVYLQAEAAYLQYVQTRALYAIALDNLRLTEGNLEIAKMRVTVGHSGRDEVFRWTAEVNRQRTYVMDVESLLETRRIDLNRILGVDQGARWRPEPLDENAYWFGLMSDKLGFAIESQTSLDRFAEVAVEVALENAPERKFLQKSIEAEGIQVGQRKRSFIVPKIFLDLDYNYNFWQSPETPELGKNMYEVRVSAILPIFNGTQRVYELQLRKSLIIELERRLRLADQFVEQRTRRSLRQIQASLPNIGYSKAAAENARKNFEVVRDKYANGIVTITDLLSAQSASFAADQDALVALYTFLLDSVDFQRAVAFFPETKNRDEIDEFVRLMRERMKAREAQETR